MSAQWVMAILYDEAYKPHDPSFERAWQKYKPDAVFGIANCTAPPSTRSRRAGTSQAAVGIATPVIGGAALLKLPPLLGPEGNGLRGPLLAGSLAAFVAAYLATRYLVRYFENRTLIPFAIYCTVAGLGSLAYFTLG
ncbi:undecaprenyl-diphosphate phosphatase [Streptomyces sp. NPDC007856]|uniref:undecaprenyl-diphosphate phosphatase n=1 Tax=Streptomyces sp. NPDC007856 TaxID=3364781 RepID=UPI0036AF558E